MIELQTRRPFAWRALGLIVALGALLRVVGLNGDLWIDEIATLVNYLRLPPWQTLAAYDSANQHLLYSFLGSISLHLFGESAWAVRLPALLFGLGGIVALYAFARAIAPEREALWATALLAVSYHHVWFSQNARGYTGMIFWSLLGSWLLLRALASDRRGAWLGYAAAMALGALTMQNTAFVFAGQLGAYGVARWRGAQPPHAATPRHLFFSAGLAVLLGVAGYGLVLPQMLEFFRSVDRTGLGSSSLAAFVPILVRGLLTGYALPALLLAGALLAAGCLSYWRQSPFVAALLLLPALFNLLALVLLRYGAYPRFFVYLLPALLLLVVRGATVAAAWLARTPGIWPRGELARAAGALLLPLLFAASLVALAPNYRYPKQDYTGALAYARARAPAGAAVAAVGLAAVAYGRYYDASLLFPDTPAALRALRAPGRAVWVLYSFSRDMQARFPALAQYLGANAAPVAQFPGTLEDGTIYLVQLR